MTTTLPTLFDAAAERDAALAQVAGNAGQEWQADAWEFICRYLRTHDELFGDDLWEAGLERPHDMRALGPLIMRARRKGYIVATGRTRPRRSGHLTAAPVWKSLLWQG